MHGTHHLLADSESVLLARSFPGSRSRVASIAADSVGDDGATLVVYLIVGLLAVIGAVLVGLAVWIWRVTKPDRELLAPLELMDDPAWRRQDPQGRRRSLDDVRPDGASPLKPSVRQPNLDEEFESEQPVADFADLTEPLEDPLVIDLDDGDDDDGWDRQLDGSFESPQNDDGPNAEDLTTAIAAPAADGADDDDDWDEASDRRPADRVVAADEPELDWDEASDSA